MSITEQLRLFDERLGHASPYSEIPLALRRSRRARRLILRLVPPRTLEVVVPSGAQPAEIEAFVSRHRPWIERARSEIARRYVAERDELPARIALRAVDLTWSVRYLHTPGARPARRVSGLDLGLVTPDREQSCVPALLRAWLLEQARTHLVPWLLREAERVGRAPSRVQVRLQRTRWGSCSSRGGISLNAGLLFLEAELVRYLLIHELCHLEVMNHSRRFWARVRRFEPDCRRLDRRLAESWADIPWWTHELM